MAAPLRNLQERFEPLSFRAHPPDRKAQPVTRESEPEAVDDVGQGLLLANCIAAAVYGPKGEKR